MCAYAVRLACSSLAGLILFVHSGGMTTTLTTGLSPTAALLPFPLLAVPIATRATTATMAAATTTTTVIATAPVAVIIQAFIAASVTKAIRKGTRGETGNY